MTKRLHTIKNCEIKPEVISIFASGSSILNIPEKSLLKIYQDTFCIWFNFAPVKFNKYIDCLCWMDNNVSKWLDKRFKAGEDIPGRLWTRRKAFYDCQDLLLKDEITYWFDDESDYLERTNLSFVICLLELTRCFPNKKILLFGFDLYGDKWYSQFLKKGDDPWKHQEDKKIDLADCDRDIDLVPTDNIYNCTPGSLCERFKKSTWENEIKYNNIMRLKGPSGFGDGIYSYPIVKHYVDEGFKVEVLTKYPEIFSSLDCKIRPFFYFNWDIDFSYVDRKFHKLTNQFQDMCKLAGISTRTKLEMDFKNKREFNTDKKVCVVQRPYWSMNEIEKRVELVPYYLRMKELIKAHPEYYYVMIGVPNSMGIVFDVDEVIEETTINDLFEIVNGSDMVLTQIGWTIAMAEILNKKVFVFFSARGLKSKDWFYRTITPSKVITKKTSSYCIDDWHWKKIEKRFNKLCLK